ncbi:MULTISPECIES: archaetidylserine synthase [Methanosarcina]|jgi:CDP-diacylglycerol--serine O-phosphatidyltransferase|uniref:CDP-diacylglycerol--serine O-phosphatidyltransferase n=9 Tax=Methanosarcina mazei TaxID=2209 RepID=A0A0F8QAP5_METMZ|nr:MULTISPECIES: archaetidylserine synthase [Methanosarcina]UWJ24643.1 CDP-diacylglycerol--serine O-phosphatidyltransferase [Methanosarcina mazei TMA]AAM31099.1 CDP-diacylglycerol--serine O-phosphatidyltransferase [Methanosarcina mazei Go1]AGF96831.1 CDP-diacylglycerol--serine O- phosphatidyltransferase [Methanosarcina mazei Tuc01]AKB42146.1 CDP-diacylglycerol--serine O-phosphatidyltransferase [Methanosarcina mazei WWM610]AKB63112.1 CDP-diacylglycerol--serine O-phosphatidyltransferase [Methano
MNVFQMLRLPDLVSLLNLICGIGSIAVAAQSDSFGFALILLLLAAVADGADGYIARRFKGGELGEQLDSLADAVSFGVAPALLIFLEFGVEEPIVGIFAGLYAVCGVLRLARFNSSISVPKAGFEGLPITAGCIMLVTYLLLGESFVIVDVLLALTLALSILMVSTVNYPKIRNIKILAFVAAVFGITMLLYFIDVQYMRVFSFLPFILMLSYLFSPFLKIPVISIATSKDYGNRKGAKAEGRKEKQ